MSQKLRRAIVEQKQDTVRKNPKISGVLGIPINGAKTVEVQNRNAYVYVRLRNNQNEVIQAFNNQVASAYNLPVLVEHSGNRYSVVGVDTQRYENNWSSFSPFLPRHGNTHSFNFEAGGGGDLVWVYPGQFTPILVIPSGSLGGPNVFINPHILKNDIGTWKYVGNTGSPNFTVYNPSSPTGAVMGLVYLDAQSGNPYLVINSGAVFSNSLTGTSQIYSYIPQITDPNNQIPLAAIRLITGTSILSWNNIYDVRQFVHTQPTGSAGGGLSSVAIQDEASAQGNVATLNFVGDGVTASVSGTVARIYVAGASGSSSFVGTPSSAVLTNASGSLFTPTWLKWGTSSNEYLEFGADEAKETNAGKIGYRFSDGGDYLDIHGAGSGVAGSPRRVRIREYLLVDEDMDVSRNFYAQFANIANGSTYNVGGTPHVHALTNESAVLGGLVTITGAAGVYINTGLSITLPSSGTYELSADVRGQLRGGTSGTSWFLTAELYNATDAAEVTNSERMILTTNDNTLSLQVTCPISAIVRVSDSKTINLYASRNGAGSPTWTQSSIPSDSNGRTTLSYIKIA